MDDIQILGKIAADKESNKLGKIIRLEKLPHILTKETELHAIILVQKFLRKDIAIPITLTRILKTEGEFVWFDIFKSDFETEVKRKRIQNKHKENSGEYVRFRDKWYGPGHARLAPRDRNKRRE